MEGQGNKKARELPPALSYFQMRWRYIQLPILISRFARTFSKNCSVVIQA